MAYRKWKPSKSSVAEFKSTMNNIDSFCAEHGISASKSNDSYYFVLNGTKYRVSNHTVAASNRGAYDWMGNQIREKYHEEKELHDTVYITAGKTRIIQIYNDLAAGYSLDRRGNRI